MLQKSKSVLLLLIVSFIVHIGWFINPIITHGDWMFHFSKTISEWVNLPVIWTTQPGFGDINIGLSGWPFMFIYGLFGFLNLNSNVADKFVFLIPITIMTGLNSYILIKKIVYSDIGALIGSLVLSYNTYVLILQTGSLLMMLAFSLAPLVIYFFLKTLEGKKVRYIVITALLMFIVGVFEFRACYILAWVLIFFVLFKILFIDRKTFRKKLPQLFLYSFLIFFIFFLLNSSWLFGFTQTKTIIQNAVFNRDLWGSGYFNIAQSLTLFHPFWTTGGGVVHDTQPITAYFFLVPIFAFLGLWLNRKNKYVIIFAIISLIGILLAKQEGEPFTHLYKWLFNYLPGFKAFREASKFYFLIALGYSVLIGSFVGWMWKNWTVNKYKIYGKYLITGLIALIFLINTKQYVSGEIGTLFVPRHIPQDYIVFKDFILNQPVYFRTLWLPTHSRWGIYTNIHPKVSVVETIGSNWLGFVNNNDAVSEQQKMVQILKQSFSKKLLDISSIKYVLVPIQDIVNDDDFFVYYGNRYFYTKALDGINFLQKIDIGTKELAVYENKGYRPHLYLTGEKETIQKDVPYTNVDFKFVNPAEYKISLKNISGPVYLNFSEAFNSNWKIRVGDFNWFDVLTKKDYFLSDSLHFKNDASLNSFIINPNGHKNLELTLYFRPQSYLYLGLFVSGITLFLCVGYLLYNLVWTKFKTTTRLK